MLSISRWSAMVVSSMLYSLEQFELTSLLSVYYHSLDYDLSSENRITMIAKKILANRMSVECMLDSCF